MDVSHKTYQRYLEPGFIPFDSLQLAEETERIVCRDDGREPLSSFGSCYSNSMGILEDSAG